MGENRCPNVQDLFTIKVIKSQVKLHVNSDAQKMNFLCSFLGCNFWEKSSGSIAKCGLFSQGRFFYTLIL